MQSKESGPSFQPVRPTARRENPALVCPWKRLLVITGVEIQNSGARRQESALPPAAKTAGLIEQENLKNRMTKDGIAALYLFK